jgi:hypothetical protein
MNTLNFVRLKKRKYSFVDRVMNPTLTKKCPQCMTLFLYL